MAARKRALASGSGRPILAATVISRLSFENIAERFLSCAPLRYMMFLYLLWPAIAVIRPSKCWWSVSNRLSGGHQSVEAERRAIGFQQRIGFLPRLRLHLAESDDGPHRLGVVAARLGLGIDVLYIVGDRLLLLLEALDALDQEPEFVRCDIPFRHVFPAGSGLSASL